MNNVGNTPINVGRMPINVGNIPINVGVIPINAGNIPINVGNTPINGYHTHLRDKRGVVFAQNAHDLLDERVGRRGVASKQHNSGTTMNYGTVERNECGTCEKATKDRATVWLRHRKVSDMQSGVAE